MRAALARGDWATVLQAFLDTGLSQTVIATSTGLSQSQVSRLANGKSREPGLRTVKALSDGLAIPRRLAGLLDRSDDAEDTTDRRQFLHGSLGVVATALLPHSDLGDDRLLMATTLSYRQLEQRTPSRDLVQPVTAHLALARNLTLRASDKQRQRLSAALSEVTGLAAWVHADVADPVRARQLYKMSISAARESGQQLLAIYMQGSFGQYAATAGDPLAGIRIIRDAAARLPKSAPDTARAWLTAIEGLTLGHLGDRSALRQLDQAQRYADAARDREPAWPWVFPFGDEKVAQCRAIAASRLGLRSQAEAAFQRANAATSGSPKQIAAAAVEHARSLAAAGHLEEACRIAVTAFDTSQSFGSERVCQSVREFHREFASAKTGTLLAELDDRMHSRYADGA
ncbi:MAG: helix-turn-helix domain-containing protein [Mycobacterium sp.]|nr:helix-turn-helix domain-containing protein [Mycobacterium sp.]